MGETKQQIAKGRVLTLLLVCKRRRRPLISLQWRRRRECRSQVVMVRNLIALVDLVAVAAFFHGTGFILKEGVHKEQPAQPTKMTTTSSKRKRTISGTTSWSSPPRFF
jgi:hypothetical protein